MAEAGRSVRSPMDECRASAAAATDERRASAGASILLNSALLHFTHTSYSLPIIPTIYP